ncbi:MAG TPA: NADH-quinone oxidoreductase subunit H, partial [Thermomicrobiales bacterium]|nr:NADH-quinone oxidoreductase subunit H [Thermomicrobiales bacterium]
MDPLLLAIQISLVILFAPLAQGIIKTSKARWQNRRGPSIFQPYFDLLKWLGRESVVSDQASWVFRLAPYIYGGAILLAAALVPTFARGSAAPG